MATESPGEAHAGDGVVDLASGDDSDTATDAEGVVGGDTDDEVPEGENYFGRASKEGAAPAGANPFAAASSAPEDDWAAQIAEAKAMVEAQRIAREKEEAAERAREKAAAELKGKTYEGRRKAGDPAPETVNADSNAGGGTGGASAHSRVRKMLKARRPRGGGGADGGAESSALSPKPFAFGASLLAETRDTSENAADGDKKIAGDGLASPAAAKAASPFAGFSLLANDPAGADARTSPPSDARDFPKKSGGGGVLSRLSGAPVPFDPPVAEVAEAEEEAEEEEGDADDGEDDDDASDAVVPPAAPLFAARPAAAAAANPAAAPSSAGNRTPLAVELDL